MSDKTTENRRQRTDDRLSDRSRRSRRKTLSRSAKPQFIGRSPAHARDPDADPHSDLRPPIGGARRDRTDDLMLAKHALSQLSYGPDKGSRQSISAAVFDCRLPKPDCRNWWAWEDLNLRPHAYQARALTN